MSFRLKPTTLVASCLIVLLSVMPGCGTGGEEPGGGEAQGNDETPTVAITIKGETFNLELALDDDARYKGLSERKSIAEDGGMLFKLTSPRTADFVMRRCYVPIDLVYLYEDGVIDSLHRMSVIEPIGGAEWKRPSKSYSSSGRVLYALEFKGGTLDRLGLKKGEKIELPAEVVQLKAQ